MQFGNYDDPTSFTGAKENDFQDNHLEIDSDSDSMISNDDFMDSDDDCQFTEEEYETAKSFINSIGSVDRAIELIQKCEECEDCLDLVSDEDRDSNIMSEVIKMVGPFQSSPDTLYNSEEVGKSNEM